MKTIASLIAYILLCSTSLHSQVSIAWVARYDGGFGDDVGFALTTDDNGNVYVTGTSWGNQTRRDLVVIKYSPVGTNLWTKRIADTATNGPMSGSDINLDRSDNVIVGGSGMYKYDTNGNLIWSNMDVGCSVFALDSVGNAYTINGNFYYITREVNTSGVLLWERIYPQYQVINPNPPHDMCIDKENNALVTGQCRQEGVVLNDYATVKYSSSGNLIWERRYNGGNEDIAYAITCDDSSNVYVTGWNRNSSTDIRTIKYSPDGDTLWQAVYDGGGFDVGYDIEVDSLGYVYVGGVTNSSSYVTLKYDVSGNLMWSRVQTSQQIPYSPVLKLDQSRNVYMSFVSFRPGLYSNYAVVKYNNDGVQQWIGEYHNGGVGLNYIRDLDIDRNNNVYVTGQSDGGHGYSIATVKFIQTPTQTNETTSSGIPESYFLEQNYPNPFNPSTTIRFDVRTAGNVLLKVFDVLGREVEVIVNDFLKSGSYSVQFSGDNLPSGVYYYELRAESYSETKRMLLVK
jgi:hypothetical protein